MKLLFTIIVIAGFCSSCGVTQSAFRKRLAVIDAPADLKIKNLKTGKLIEIKMKVSRSEQTGYNVVTAYKTPSINLKVKKGTILELESQGIKKTVELKAKPNIGMLVLEGIFSLGTFAIIDLAFGANKSYKPQHLDVPAILSGKPQRSEKEINQYIRENSH
ncbi:MAG: hypothetical protein QM541_06875 [Flavobacterium sp.]|nr:hypothetical protein [Flavobacterium sp.]